MMQADDAIHPALAACASLDSVELFDVDLGGGSSNVSAANASSPSPTTTSSAAHRSTSSPPPVPPMTGTRTNICADEPPKWSQKENQIDATSSSSEKGPIANEDEAKRTEKHGRHIRKLTAYNLISPAPALEKAPSSDSATVTTTSSGSISMSSSSSMLSAMDNDYEEDVKSTRSMGEKVTEVESNDRGVYHFKVSKVKPQTEIRQGISVSTLSVEDTRRSGEAKSNGEEIMSIEVTSSKSGQRKRLESINEASQIKTVSTMSGPHDNKERPENDQRGVYRFKVQVDEAQLRRAEWWKLW